MKRKKHTNYFAAVILCFSFFFSSIPVYGYSTNDVTEDSKEAEDNESGNGQDEDENILNQKGEGSEDDPEEENPGTKGPETEDFEATNSGTEGSEGKDSETENFSEEEPDNETFDLEEVEEEIPVKPAMEEISENSLQMRADLNNTYENPVGSFEALFETVESAPQGQETIITVIDSFEMTQRINIKEGQNIVLINDQEERTISRGSNMKATMFGVDYGGIFTIKENTDGSFIFDSGGMRASGNRQRTGDIVDCRGTFNLEGGILTGCEVSRGYSAVVLLTGDADAEPAVFNMSGGEISDNIFVIQQSTAVAIYGNTEFNMSGGKIDNNRASEGIFMNGIGECGAGGVSVSSGKNKGPASFYMSGGEISNNHSSQGGVSLYSYYGTENDSVNFIMNGGSITGNEADYAGGGVLVFGNSRFIMERGDITGNKAVGFGGGVATYDAYERGSIEEYMKLYPAQFIMNGGKIEGNEATSPMSFGGGIYIASHRCEINKGEIINNYAGKEGGGIYIGSVPYILNINNAVITDNYAAEDGGGIWLCPTGSLETKVTGGMALFGNTADRAGDDLASEAKNGEFFNLLSERMLGGGAVLWYSDNAGERYSLGSEDSQPMNLDKIITEDCYGTAKVSEEAIRAALVNYTVLISGNEAGRCGGGIGTNGGVEIGRDGLLTIEISKQWDISEDRELLKAAENPTPPDIPGEPGIPDKIQVYLWINGEIHPEEYFLTPENEWYLRIENLPDVLLSSGSITDYYKITEGPVNGFKSHIEQDYNEDENVLIVKIVNTKDKPSSNPSQPEPPKPEPPQSNPSQPNNEEDDNDRDRPEKELPEKGKPESAVPDLPKTEDTPEHDNENIIDIEKYEQVTPDEEIQPEEEVLPIEEITDAEEILEEEISENNFVKENPKTSDPLENTVYLFFIWVSLLAAVLKLQKRPDRII